MKLEEEVREFYNLVRDKKPMLWRRIKSGLSQLPNSANLINSKEVWLALCEIIYCLYLKSDRNLLSRDDPEILKESKETRGLPFNWVNLLDEVLLASMAKISQRLHFLKIYKNAFFNAASHILSRDESIRIVQELISEAFDVIELSLLERYQSTDNEQGVSTLFQRFAEASGQGFGIGTLDGRIIYMNPALKRLLHLNPQVSFAGLSFLPFYPDEFQKKMMTEVIPTTLEQGQWMGELCLRTLSGDKIPTHETYFLIRDDRKNPMFLAVGLTSLKKQKEAEKILLRGREELEKLVLERTGKLEELNNKLLDEIAGRRHVEQLRQQSQQMLETVMDAIPVRIFWKDRHLDYMGCNLLFARDAGMESPQQMIGLDDFVMPWKDRADIYRSIDSKVLDSGEPVIDFEERQTDSKGKRLWLKVSKIPLRNEQGEVYGVLGTYEDITQAKVVEKDLKRLAEEKELLLREVNHRVKNNLATISSLILRECEMAEKSGNQALFRHLYDLHQGVNGLTLLHNLLSSTGWKTVPVKSLAEMIFGGILQGSILFEKDVALDISGVEVLLDDNKAHQMTLIFNELVTNSLNHAFADQDSPAIHLNVKKTETDVLIEYGDNGCGFPDLALDNLLPSSHLGLELVKDIVSRNLNGKLDMHNDGGARVVMSIPLRSFIIE